jgi:hypothetical protein
VAGERRIVQERDEGSTHFTPRAGADLRRDLALLGCHLFRR